MLRRTFMSLVAGLLGLRKAAPVSHEYDWQERTIDGVKARLPYGGRDVHVVYLDGKDVHDLPIFRLRTGVDGYIDHYVGNYGEPFEHDRFGYPLVVRQTGNVEYVVCDPTRAA